MKDHTSGIVFSKPNQWLFIAVALYFLMNGAQLWETAIMVPAWTAAPPASLIFFQEPYGVDFKIFWIVVHSVHDLAFIVALIFSWKIPVRRNWMLLLLSIHVVVRIWTLAYFAPQLMAFQELSYSNSVDRELTERAAIWRNLNYLRVAIYFGVNLSLLPLFKVNSK